MHLEQSLLQAEKIAATGRMTATIAHEVNNSLEGGSRNIDSKWRQGDHPER
jgi:C4-dicarboxylate-specific signal transduction histidine kinase